MHRSHESHPNSPQSMAQGLSRAVALVWNTHPALTLMLAVTTLLQALVPLASAWISKLVVDSVVQAIGNAAKLWDQLGPIFMLAFLVGFAGQVLSGFAQASQGLLRDLLTQRVNSMIIQKAVTMDVSYYETPAFYDMLQRAQQEASYRPLSMLQQIFSLGRSSVTFLTLAGLLLNFNPWIVILLVGTSAPALLVQSAYGRTAFQVYSGRAPEWRKLSYLSMLLTAKQFVKEIKLFGLAPSLIDRYRELYTKFNRENRELSIRRNLQSTFLQVLALFGYFVAYGAVISATVAGNLTIGDLTMYSAVLMQVQATASSLVFGIGDLYEQNLFLGNLFAFLKLEPRIGSGGQLAPTVLRSGIVLKNVTFSYPGACNPTLKNIDLVIAPGEKVALVGENGAGKTTLIKLLVRFYDPTEGTITLDGVDLRTIDPASLHARVGVIFQDFVQYHLTGRENVGFGQVDALEDKERVEMAARKSGAHDMLCNLPKGYDTLLGRWLDDQGTDFSIGQWQKIALARAYMRDAPILILDEPTSALDPKAEYEVYSRFRQLAADRTVILISHRFSTVRMADRIVVLDKGTIIEQGTHAELLRKRGLYSTMFSLQAEGYQPALAG